MAPDVYERYQQYMRYKRYICDIYKLYQSNGIIFSQISSFIGGISSLRPEFHLDSRLRRNGNVGRWFKFADGADGSIAGFGYGPDSVLGHRERPAQPQAGLMRSDAHRQFQFRAAQVSGSDVKIDGLQWYRWVAVVREAGVDRIPAPKGAKSVMQAGRMGKPRKTTTGSTGDANLQGRHSTI